MLAQPSSNKLFGHVVVEQQGDAFGEAAATFPGAYKGDGFVFLLATVVRVSQGLRWKGTGHVRLIQQSPAAAEDCLLLAAVQALSSSVTYTPHLCCCCAGGGGEEDVCGRTGTHPSGGPS